MAGRPLRRARIALNNPKSKGFKETVDPEDYNHEFGHLTELQNELFYRKYGRLPEAMSRLHPQDDDLLDDLIESAGGWQGLEKLYARRKRLMGATKRNPAFVLDKGSGDHESFSNLQEAHRLTQLALESRDLPKHIKSDIEQAEALLRSSVYRERNWYP